MLLFVLVWLKTYCTYCPFLLLETACTSSLAPNCPRCSLYQVELAIAFFAIISNVLLEKSGFCPSSVHNETAHARTAIVFLSYLQSCFCICTQQDSTFTMPCLQPAATADNLPNLGTNMFCECHFARCCHCKDVLWWCLNHCERYADQVC